MPTRSQFENSILTIQAGGIQVVRGRCDILDEAETRVLWAILLGCLGPRIRVFASNPRRIELLRVTRPKEFGPMSEIHDYPVFDLVESLRIGTVRLTNDGWILLDKNRRERGCFRRVQNSEDKLKQKAWAGYNDDAPVCQVVQWASGAAFRMTMDCSPDTKRRLDRRLVLSSVLVLAALEATKYQTC
jgi:hypothetical protein